MYEPCFHILCVPIVQYAYMNIRVHIEDDIVELADKDDFSSPSGRYIGAQTFKIRAKHLGVTTLYVSRLALLKISLMLSFPWGLLRFLNQEFVCINFKIDLDNRSVLDDILDMNC